MDMYPPSDHELDSLPHVVLTSDADWDPTMADNEIDPDDVWYDALDTEPPPATSAYGNTKFDQLLPPANALAPTIHDHLTRHPQQCDCVC